MPTEVIMAIGSFAIGATFAWVIASWVERQKREDVTDRVERLRDDLAYEERQTAKAEALLDETRKQCTMLKNENKLLTERTSQSERALAAKNAQLREREERLTEQKALVDQAKRQLADTFRSLAADALEKNNKGFLVLAEEQFKAIKQEAATDLDARKEAIECLVKPVSDTLAAYQKETRDLEDRRLREISAVGEQLRSVAVTHDLLRTETAKLINALKSPHTRGRWGEVLLKKVLELADMLPYCVFLQETTETEDGWIRPDAVVKLPACRDVVVDSKVPSGDFWDAIDATSDEQRLACFERHAL